MLQYRWLIVLPLCGLLSMPMIRALRQAPTDGTAGGYIAGVLVLWLLLMWGSFRLGTRMAKKPTPHKTEDRKS